MEAVLTWREAFDGIRSDMSVEELTAQIAEIEGAIFIRMQELQNVKDSNGEFKQMVEVMREIRRLQIEKLNYPDFSFDLPRGS
jgi:hypothetical protein